MDDDNDIKGLLIGLIFIRLEDLFSGEPINNAVIGEKGHASLVFPSSAAAATTHAWCETISSVFRQCMQSTFCAGYKEWLPQLDKV